MGRPAKEAQTNTGGMIRVRPVKLCRWSHGNSQPYLYIALLLIRSITVFNLNIGKIFVLYSMKTFARLLKILIPSAIMNMIANLKMTTPATLANVPWGSYCRGGTFKFLLGIENINLKILLLRYARFTLSTRRYQSWGNIIFALVVLFLFDVYLINTLHGRSDRCIELLLSADFDMVINLSDISILIDG